ncbi:MAG: bi-domain-containing oxidoreductase, partial [Gammaproteobacteria bacterium]|nr:bi-domain-containing oxidoreductase [Gammaproteobacteria bacterium]
MKQILQELGSGRTVLTDVPAPRVSPVAVGIATRCSLISAGTERMLVEFGRAGWLERIRQQPGRLRQVLDKARTDGLLQTVAAVRSKLDQPLPLGYCNVGVVVDPGSGAGGLAVGDRVVSNGPHAEMVAVPCNLCARIPAGVSDEAATFAVIGAIGLEGIRLAAPTLGESFAVIGLGLIGLMTVQLLRANGCRVLGIDPDASRRALARRFGAETVDLDQGGDVLAAAASFSRRRGMDGVLITAATDSNEPIAQAAYMCRKRGRIVLVGVAGLQLERADFYAKELSFQVSCSYGPGRYDPAYEEHGADYPIGYVRWTEQRNFEAVLDMVAMGVLEVTPLITHRFAIADAAAAYELLATRTEPYLGILLQYPSPPAAGTPARSIELDVPRGRGGSGRPAIAVIGAGNYASRVLIPAFSRSPAELVAIASSGGVSAAHHGRRFGFRVATTDAQSLLIDPRIEAVVVATRHDTHARFAIQALQAGKHVFVEKPLAISLEELTELEEVWRGIPAESRPLVMVGFNRRFAPHALRLKKALQAIDAPRTIVVTVNAGALPQDHWTRDSSVGGGRIIAEACHFIDLARFLAGAAIVRSRIVYSDTARGGAGDTNATITLEFTEGSTAVIHYLTNGHPSFPKERVEVFSGGHIARIDNFRHLQVFGWGRRGGTRLWRQDKGQQECV